MTEGKNIVLCSDGTGNTANKNRGTNVFKIFEAIDVNGHTDGEGRTRQIAFYDDGVGTSQFLPLTALGGAFGWGLARNVRQLYRALCRSYRPGDRIYLFGFSRGAFTVRTLAGFIMNCGLVDVNDPAEIPGLKWIKPGSSTWLRLVSWLAWRKHRRFYRAWLEKILLPFLKGGEQATRGFRNRYTLERKSEADRARIHFVGVWDTVAAVGLPFDELTWFVNKFIYRFSFRNNILNDRVEKGCHALSIDDERRSFKPEVWKEKRDDLLKPCQCRGEGDLGETENEPRIEQVWFAGVHSNVGGGYRKQGMSLVALDWMMAKAEQHGLVFNAVARKSIRENRNVHDKLYNSRSGAKIYYRYKPRDLKDIAEKTNARIRIHASALDRIRAQTDDYAPTSPPTNLTVVDTPTEQRTDLTQLESKIKGATPHSTAFAVGVRLWAQVGLFVVTGALVWMAAKMSGGLGALVSKIMAQNGSPTVLYQEMIKPVFTDATLRAIFLTSIAIVWLVSFIAKGRITRARRAFWREV